MQENTRTTHVNAGIYADLRASAVLPSFTAINRPRKHKVSVVNYGEHEVFMCECNFIYVCSVAKLHWIHAWRFQMCQLISELRKTHALAWWTLGNGGQCCIIRYLPCVRLNDKTTRFMPWYLIAIFEWSANQSEMQIWKHIIRKFTRVTIKQN